MTDGFSTLACRKRRLAHGLTIAKSAGLIVRSCMRRMAAHALPHAEHRASQTKTESLRCARRADPHRDKPTQAEQRPMRLPDGCGRHRQPVDAAEIASQPRLQALARLAASRPGGLIGAEDRKGGTVACSSGGTCSPKSSDAPYPASILAPRWRTGSPATSCAFGRIGTSSRGCNLLPAVARFSLSATTPEATRR